MKKYLRFISTAVSFAILAAVVVAIFNRQAIADWWTLRDYSPPARVAKLADDTTMLADTRRLFYVNKPSLDDKDVFNQHCQTTEQSIVLGCFVEHTGIFILDVKDPRLSGVHEVTAAHEVLHAAYDRLSGSEREHIDSLTTQFFATVTDERIKKVVENYRQKDPGIVPNELHSILGTEVENLSSELEAYYAQYFGDRKQIVALSKQYEKTFIDLRNQVSSYDEQLTALKADIDTGQTEAGVRIAWLDSERERMDELLRNNETQQYNAAVAGFNQRVNDYNALVQRVRSLVSQYNSLVEKRNAVATEEQDLVHAIDSNFRTETRQ